MAEFKHDKYTRKALDMVRHGENLFITGKAGTGKTMLLKEIAREAEKYGKQVAICAPTGVAAKNAGGVTLHHLLGLPISIYIPGHKIDNLYSLSYASQEVIKLIDMLIIDEVSMVRCDLLDMIDDVLRHYRDCDSPFGGLQIVLFGDLRQLMPVATDEDELQLKKYYKDIYFFCSDVIKEANIPMLELETVHRQSDVQFISMLNRIRDGKLSYDDECILRNKYDKDFNPSDSQHYIRLTTHRYKAGKINTARLSDLRGEVEEYKAYIDTDGYIPKELWPNDYYLKLKEGARVMFIYNDKDGRYVNGTFGTVTYLGYDQIIVRTDDGHLIDVPKAMWEFYRYKVNKEKKKVERYLLGSFHQYPIRLAWAVTIHKSQGLTFERVIIDAGKAFTYGQVYVALSRCRSLDGLVLSSMISRNKIQVDELVEEYMQLVERVWPDEEKTESESDKSETEDYLKSVGYTPIGHAFKAPWDGKYYDAWESARSEYHLDRLVEEGGSLRRLSVGVFSDERPLFDVLASRDYESIKSVEHFGGQASKIAVSDEEGEFLYSYLGRIYRDYHLKDRDADEVWDDEPILRAYSFERSGNDLKIVKKSKLSTSYPSTIKDYSDLGKLLLSCECCRIQRNDTATYTVAFEDKGDFKILRYGLDGKAKDIEAKRIADIWYRKNAKIASIKKSYEDVPITRSPVRKREDHKPKPQSISSALRHQWLESYSEESLEYKILEHMASDVWFTAREISKHTDFSHIDITRALSSRLYPDGFVVRKGNNWRLK